MNVGQKPNGCEEAVILFPGQEKPFACNKQPEAWIGWTERGEGPYRMCAEHVYHSVKNRNATDLGPWEEGAEPPVMEEK